MRLRKFSPFVSFLAKNSRISRVFFGSSVTSVTSVTFWGGFRVILGGAVTVWMLAGAGVRGGRIPGCGGMCASGNKVKATPVGFFLSMIFSLSGIADTGDEAARPSGCPDEKLH